MVKGPDGRWGVVLEIFTEGGSKPFLQCGMGGEFFYHFFPFYKILTKFSAIFIISSLQFEIFMGVLPPP